MQTIVNHNLRPTPQRLNVAWEDGGWMLRICRKRSGSTRQVRAAAVDGYGCRISGLRAKGSPRDSRAGFTLIELLIVMGIIALLLSFLLPGIAAIKLQQKKNQARTDMKAIEVALATYYSAYSRYPQPGTLNVDATFGPTSLPGVEQENSELMAILMNQDRLSNTGHARNPQGIICLNTHQTTSFSGVGPDLVFRDPWGNPYVITVDYNFNNRCRDSFYRLAAVSEKSGDAGYNSLSRTPPDTGDSFELSGAVMIWSLGPDGKADPAQSAVSGVNKDNILNWSN